MPKPKKKLPALSHRRRVYCAFAALRVTSVGVRLVLIGAALAIVMSSCASGTIAAQDSEEAAKPSSVYRKPKPQLEPAKPNSSPAKPNSNSAKPNSNSASQQQEQSRPDVSPDLLVRNQPVIMRAEAYGGLPYGIGKVRFRLQLGDEMIERVGATLLSDSENRIFYPVISRSAAQALLCLLYTSPSPRDQRGSRMPSSA